MKLSVISYKLSECTKAVNATGAKRKDEIQKGTASGLLYLRGYIMEICIILNQNCIKIENTKRKISSDLCKVKKKHKASFPRYSSFRKLVE